MAKEEKDETKSSEQLGFPYTSTILPASAVSELKSIDGKIEPINLVEYRDDQNEVVTPLPLYIPKKEIEDELTKQDDPKIKPQNIMQTFLKMSSVIYSMAGLGTVEESKIYREIQSTSYFYLIMTYLYFIFIPIHPSEETASLA